MEDLPSGEIPESQELVEQRIQNQYDNYVQSAVPELLEDALLPDAIHHAYTLGKN